MSRERDIRKLLEREKLLRNKKRREINPIIKVIDSESGQPSEFYSPTFAYDEAREKAKQSQEQSARRVIKLKNKPEE